MKKYILFLGLLGAGSLYAQKDRVGINTATPRATLDVSEYFLDLRDAVSGSPQGVIFPHFTTSERNQFDASKLTEGLMIYNTTEKCIEFWNGTKWTCMKRTNPVIPAGLTILEGERVFVSVFDNDYLPYNGPVGAATLSSLPADGTLDRLIDVQGTITTTGVEVYVPVRVTQNLTLPAFQTQTAVEAQFTEDGISRNVSLSWEAQNLTPASTHMVVRVKSVGGTLNLKKLDFNSGLGTDYRGHLIARFTYNSTLAGTQKVNFDIRLMPGIPDKNIAVQTNGLYEHSFVYVPVKDNQTNRIWLNNNLGANYTNIDSPAFDPGEQVKNINDQNAFGSLFEWGREADGHELGSYQAHGYVPKYGWDTTFQMTVANRFTPGNSMRRDGSTWGSIGPLEEWSERADTKNYIDGWHLSSSPNIYPKNEINSCPTGFRMPTRNEIRPLIQRYKTDVRINYRHNLVVFPTSANVVKYDSGVADYPVVWTGDYAIGQYDIGATTNTGSFRHMYHRVYPYTSILPGQYGWKTNWYDPTIMCIDCWGASNFIYYGHPGYRRGGYNIPKTRDMYLQTFALPVRCIKN